MDSLAFRVTSLVHRAEEMRLPFVSAKTVVLGTVVGVPLAILLHDTSSMWLPAERNIPIISWFIRKWRQDPNEKSAHLRLLRNAVLFLFVAATLNQGEVKLAPLQYVSERVTSSSARATLSDEVQRSRRASFAAADTLIDEDMMNDAICEQQRDAALRRRYVHDSRTTHQ